MTFMMLHHFVRITHKHVNNNKHKIGMKVHIISIIPTSPQITTKRDAKRIGLRCCKFGVAHEDSD